jgi:hypothetical protein
MTQPFAMPRKIFRWCSLNNRTCVEHCNTIGNKQGCFNVMRNEQNRAAMRGKLPELLQGLGYHLCMQAGRGLISNNELRPAYDSG